MGKKLVTLVLALTIGVLLGEVLIRLAGIAPEVALVSVGRFQLSDDPELGYEPIPRYEYQGDDLYFHEFVGRANGLGMRDRDHPVAKPDGEYRIAVLGDSITMGLYVAETSDVYTHRLASGLAASHPRVRVMNFGVSGYNTSQEVRTLETKALDYDPDLVILQYCMNDRRSRDGGIVKELRAREAGGLDSRWVSPALSRSALYRYLRWTVFGADLEAAKSEREEGLTRLKGDSVEGAFDRLSELGAEHGFEVLVVVFPRLGPERDTDAADYRWLEERSGELGFEHLDLREAFDTCRASEEIARDGLHPNAAGHACAAREIQRVLLSRWRLPNR